MSRHARIEEVSDSDSASDSDPMEMDPADFDPSKGNHHHSSLIDPTNIPSQHPGQPTYASAADAEKYKSFQCVYPIYFDRTRSRVQGRRVNKDQAVDSPLARDLVDAVAGLGLKALFEPGKMHPKDWSNPGRVKVRVKEGGKAVNPRVHNSTTPGHGPTSNLTHHLEHHLYSLIAEYLRAHPTTDQSARRMLIPGLPPPDPNKPLPGAAVPRGWKINAILPLHSPALTGGGVSEDMMKDMLAGMGGGMGLPGMPSPGQIDSGRSTPNASDSGSKKKKKEKRKVIRA